MTERVEVSKPAMSLATAARAELQRAVGKRIAETRIALDIGQAECARAAGIDTSSMFRIESGAQNLTLDTLARVSLALGVPMGRLVDGVAPDPAIIELRSRR